MTCLETVRATRSRVERERTRRLAEEAWGAAAATRGWHLPLRSRRQEHQGFKVNLGYIGSSLGYTDSKENKGKLIVDEGRAVTRVACDPSSRGRYPGICLTPTHVCI